MTGKIMLLRERGTSTIQALADAFRPGRGTPTGIPAVAVPATAALAARYR